MITRLLLFLISPTISPVSGHVEHIRHQSQRIAAPIQTISAVPRLAVLNLSSFFHLSSFNFRIKAMYKGKFEFHECVSTIEKHEKIKYVYSFLNNPSNY